MFATRLRTIVLFSTLAFMGACSALDMRPDEEDSPALIIFYSDTTLITVADTVSSGATFLVKLDTYGGGCTRNTVRTDVSVTGRVVELRPYNRTRGFPGQGCTSDLMLLRHEPGVRVNTPGPLTIRVIGQQRGSTTGGDNAPASLTKVITVR